MKQIFSHHWKIRYVAVLMHPKLNWRLRSSSCRPCLWSSSHLPSFSSVPFPDLLLSWHLFQVLLPLLVSLSLFFVFTLTPHFPLQLPICSNNTHTFLVQSCSWNYYLWIFFHCVCSATILYCMHAILNWCVVLLFHVWALTEGGFTAVDKTCLWLVDL